MPARVNQACPVILMVVNPVGHVGILLMRIGSEVSAKNVRRDISAQEAMIQVEDLILLPC